MGAIKQSPMQRLAVIDPLQINIVGPGFSRILARDRNEFGQIGGLPFPCEKSLLAIQSSRKLCSCPIYRVLTFGDFSIIFLRYGFAAPVLDQNLTSVTAGRWLNTSIARHPAIAIQSGEFTRDPKTCLPALSHQLEQLGYSEDAWHLPAAAQLKLCQRLIRAEKAIF